MTAMELELSDVTDPYLNWKLSSKGKQRTVRRRRISFTELIIKPSAVKHTKRILRNTKVSTAQRRKRAVAVDDEGEKKKTRRYRKKSTAKISNKSPGLLDKEPKTDGDISVSESEKLGVTLLGKRFSASEKFVPIKKRRIYLEPSSLPRRLDASESCEGKYAADGNTTLEIKGASHEFPDFSGISLLASAACNIRDTDDIVVVSKPPLIDITVQQGIYDERMTNAEKRPCNVELGVAKDDLLDSSTATEVAKEHVLEGSMMLLEPLFLCRSSVADHGEENVCCPISRVDDSYQHECQLEGAPSLDIDTATETDRPSLVGSTLISEGAKLANAPTSLHPCTAYTGSRAALVGSTPRSEGAKLANAPNSLHPCIAYMGSHDEIDRHIIPTEVAKLVNAPTSLHPCTAYMGSHDEIDRHIIPTDKESIHVTSHSSESLPAVDQGTEAIIPEKDRELSSVSDHPVQISGCDLIKVDINGDNKASICTDSNQQISSSLCDSPPSTCMVSLDGIDRLIIPTDKDSVHVTSHLSESLRVVDQGTEAIIPEKDRVMSSVSDPHVQIIDCDLIEVDINGDNKASLCTDSNQPISSSLCDSHPSTCEGSLNHEELSSGSTSVTGHLPTAVDMKMKSSNFLVTGDGNSNRKSDDLSHVASNNSTSCLAGNSPVITCAPAADVTSGSPETGKSDFDNFGNSPDEVALGDHAYCSYDSHASQTGSDQVIGPEKVEHMSDDDSQYEDGEIRGSVINFWGEDEGETECVDYGSDSREMDVETDDRQIDNVELKKMGILDASYANRDVPEAWSNKQNARPQTFTQGTSVADIWGTNTGRHRGSAMILTNETKKYNEFSDRSDRARETFCSKSFGQDQWPEDCTRFRDGMDPANKYRPRVPYNACNAETMRSTAPMRPRKYPSSQFDRSKISNDPSRNDRCYEKASRCDEYSATRRPYRHTDNRVREDDWVDYRNRRIPVSHDSPGYSNPFTRLGPKNAFLAAVANLERNGFVVAHDGTILKADSGRRAPQSANPSQRSNYSDSRRPPTDKGGSFGVRVHDDLREMNPDRHTSISRIRTDRDVHAREKYHADGPNREACYRTGRSFSPQRGPLHLSRPQNRSSSRSRSRSPMWTPPRESIDHGRRRSRSPYMESSEVRVDRTRSRMQEMSKSSQRRPDFESSTTGYAPSVRNHDSRWPDVSPDRFREHQYQRSPERRIHTPGISQVQKFDRSETPERLRPDKGYQPMRSGRFLGSVAARDSRHLMSNCNFDGAPEELKNDLEDGPGTVCEEELELAQVSNPGGKVSGNMSVLQSTL